MKSKGGPAGGGGVRLLVLRNKKDFKLIVYYNLTIIL